MQKMKSRSLDLIVEEQITKWQHIKSKQKQKQKETRPFPCITISRDPGSGGTEVARRLAKDLGMDLIGSKIIQQVAERADISEKIIASLDEKEVRLRDVWIDSMFRTRHIWPDEYLRYLTKVIGTIGKQGRTIIIGRGGQFILPPEETFRIRLTAPREIRIRNVMRDSNTDFETSERYVYKTETDRNAFHCKHFRADWTNPIYYDLTVNTGYMGIEGAIAPITDYPVEMFDRVLAVNVRGVFLGLKHALPVMQRQGGGSIVITSSVAGYKGGAHLSAYSASKHAVVGLMRSAVLETGASGVRINTIHPAPIDTRMMRSIEHGRAPGAEAAAKQMITTRIPAGRYGSADEVALTALFLASDDSRFCTGGRYPVDGGMSAG